MANIKNPFIFLLSNGGGGESVKPYHVIQTSIDANTSTLSITDYNPSITTDNYLLGFYDVPNGQLFYLLDEYTGGN